MKIKLRLQCSHDWGFGGIAIDNPSKGKTIARIIISCGDYEKPVAEHTIPWEKHGSSFGTAWDADSAVEQAQEWAGEKIATLFSELLTQEKKT